MAELGNIGEHRYFHGIDKFFVGRQIIGGLGENAVCTRFNTRNGALDGGIQTFDRNGIRARNQEKIRVCFCICGGLHAVCHFLFADDLLARPMAATLCAYLVFNMAGCRAKFDERFHRAGNIKCRWSKAGVDIDHEWQITNIGDAANIREHVVKRVDAQIRQAE